MAIVPNLSDLQKEYQSYLQGGLKKGSGFSFGHDSTERMEYHRKEYHRISFVPCSANGVPKVGGETQTDALERKLLGPAIQVFLQKNGFLAALQLLQHYAYPDSEVGGRKMVELYVNPYNTDFKWSRDDKQSGSKTFDKKISSGADRSLLERNNLTAFRGRTAADWGAITGIINLKGYSGNAPEIQLPRLKYIYGMQDPSWRNQLSLYAMGSTNTDNLLTQGGAYSPDPAQYLWEMWYPIVYLKDKDNSYPNFKKPMRYFGYVQSLNLTQANDETSLFSQTDIFWEMNFAVLQRRDYANINGL